MNMKKLLLIPLLLLTVLSMAEVMTNRLDPDNRKLPNNREKKRMENQKLPMYLL